MSFITENLATIIVGLVILLVVGLIIRKMVRDKRAGKSGCGCGCGSCPSSSMCHSQKKES